MSFWIQITNAVSTQYGEIRTAEYFRGTKKRDGDGEFEFAMPASDPSSALLVKHRIARCFSIYENTVTEVGAMIIDKVVLQVDEDGKSTFVVSGNGLLRGLVYRHVGSLSIGASGSPTTGGPGAVIALAPTGWSLDTVNGFSASSKAINHDFEGETVLEALGKVAELTGEHFRMGSTAGGAFKVVWMQDQMVDSGVRLVQGGDPIAIASNLDVALIQGLEVEEDSFDGYVGRVYAKGSGDGSASVDLSGASVSYTGYSIGSDSKGYYLQHDATWSAYGIEVLMVWSDDGDQATLVEDAYEWLKRHIGDATFYTVTVAKLDRLLNVGSTVRLIFRGWTDSYQWADIDDDLVILSMTIEVDNAGARTTELEVVSTSVDRERETDASAIMSGLGNADSYVIHSQPVDGGVVVGPFADDMYPNAILRDGSRSLIGNLAVGAGFTIDGVDISAHVLLPDVHHIGFVGLKDNAGAAISPNSVDLIQVAAGTLINSVAGSSILTISVKNGTAQYQVPVTGASPYTPAYTSLAGMAGNGIGFSAGVFSISGGTGLLIGADSIDLNTPGTLTVSTTNVAAGTHTHAITASSNVLTVPAASILKSDGAGGVSVATLAATYLSAANVISSLVPESTDTYDLGYIDKALAQGLAL